MKFLTQTIIIGLFSYVAGIFFPWWSVAVVSFLVGTIFYTRSLNAFLAGFLGVGLLWFFYALSIDIATSSILTKKVAALFNLTEPFFMVIITSIVGGITAGFSALSGNQLLKLWSKKGERGRYGN